MGHLEDNSVTHCSDLNKFTFGQDLDEMISPIPSNT